MVVSKMTREYLESLGFKLEILPSGRINLSNKTQFRINGAIAYFCSKGEYHKTMNQTSIEAMLSYITKIELI
jgi:hypothetical protein